MIVVALVACTAVMLWAASGFAGEKPEAKPDFFNKIDTNADRKITESEFNEYSITHPELGLTKSVFTKWDRDQDGVVTYEEFQVVQPLEKKAAPAEKGSCTQKKAALKKGGTCPMSKAVEKKAVQEKAVQE